MAKNPLFLDKVILKNGGTIERVDGTAIVSVNAAGTTTSITGTETIVASEIALASGKMLIGNGSGLAEARDVSGDATLGGTGILTIANNAVTATKVVDNTGAAGLFVSKKAFAVYDFAIDGGAQGAIVLTNAATLPDNAVVTAFTYDVITTCTSATDAATIALSLPVDGALTTAIAISDGSNPWDIGVHLASVVTPLAVKTTAARAIGLTVAGGENLTAGKIVFCVDYYVSQ